jgi:copper homeostasis protein CutC
VFGALDAAGNIDEEKMRVVRKLSEGMLLTFHRAFDVCSAMRIASAAVAVATTTTTTTTCTTATATATATAAVASTTSKASTALAASLAVAQAPSSATEAAADAASAVVLPGSVGAVLDQLVRLGCDRLLTSGGPHSNVHHNITMLQTIVSYLRSSGASPNSSSSRTGAGTSTGPSAAERAKMLVVAGAGVSAENVQQLLHAIPGLCAVHAGSSVTIKVGAGYAVPSPGGCAGRAPDSADPDGSPTSGAGTVFVFSSFLRKKSMLSIVLFSKKIPKICAHVPFVCVYTIFF